MSLADNKADAAFAGFINTTELARHLASSTIKGLIVLFLPAKTRLGVLPYLEKYLKRVPKFFLRDFLRKIWDKRGSILKAAVAKILLDTKAVRMIARGSATGNRTRIWWMRTTCPNH